jgi:hypothetical protein
MSKSERQFPAHIDMHEKPKSKLAFMTAVGLSLMALGGILSGVQLTPAICSPSGMLLASQPS